MGLIQYLTEHCCFESFKLVVKRDRKSIDLWDSGTLKYCSEVLKANPMAVEGPMVRGMWRVRLHLEVTERQEASTGNWTRSYSSNVEQSTCLPCTHVLRLCRRLSFKVMD